MKLFNQLKKKLDYLDEGQIARIHQAYLVAQQAHHGQMRQTGEPYITHPVAVACLLADIKLDYQTIIAALLHDVIEDTPITKQDLTNQFGEAVTDLVDGVSKLNQIEFVSRAEAQAESFRKMLLAMAKDIRVILVKLADRLHNMRTLDSLKTQKKQRIARETLDIYSPIAKRLGMREFSVELEQRSFEVLYPRRYNILKEHVRKARGHRKKVLDLVNKTLADELDPLDYDIISVSGREKHLYSIYRKMKKKKIPFNEIMDVYAFRIIVRDIDTCYRVLGRVHSLFKPVPERFKDYISIPKANGYQSLHTTLFGPYGLPIEIQIRTKEMEQIASNGIAAHWLYKSGQKDINESKVRAQQWVKNLLELQQGSGNSLEFFESVKVDLFPDEVYVFTPKGDIMQLPAGATVLDFAYQIHTDIGNSCVSAKLDRQFVPLSTELVNGQTVEIITSLRGRPNPAWLDFVITSKARNSIRHYLKSQRREDSITLGKKLLKNSLKNHHLTIRKIPKERVDYYLDETKLKNINDLYIDIGLGNRAPILVAQRLAYLTQGMNQDNDLPADRLKREAPISIQGTEGLLISFADCCCPIPGDTIAGVLMRGEGMMIHTDQCPAIQKIRKNPEKCLSLRWSEHIEGEFAVKIRLQMVNERGILAITALAISDTEANIEDINVTDRDGQHYLVDFELKVKNRYHLAQIMRLLRQIPAMRKITRMRL